MWRNHIPKLKIIFLSQVLASSDKSPYRKLTFHNVFARRGSSYSNRARFNFKEAFALRDMKIATWEGYRVRQKMTYHFSFCWLNSACTGKSRLSMCRISKAIIFLFSGKTQWQMFLSLLIRPPCLCPSEGQKHGISIRSSINLGDTLLQITRKWKTAETWFLASLFIYQSSIVSQILDFIHWMV